MSNISTAILPPRAITFSKYSDLFFIPSYEDKYSDDMRHFHQTLIDDARQASRMIKD